jgi:hypothetical protein
MRLDGPSATKSLENSWSISKKRKQGSEDGLYAGEYGSPSDRTVVADDGEAFGDPDTPSRDRKTAKTAKLSTPHQMVPERRGKTLQAMSTSRLGKQPMSPAIASASRSHDETSPALGSFQHGIGRGNERNYKLTTTVVNLINHESIHFSKKTMLRIRLEINKELEQHEAIVRQYEQTIEELFTMPDQTSEPSD